MNRRFVAFNGGIGTEQLTWLDAECQVGAAHGPSPTGIGQRFLFESTHAQLGLGSTVTVRCVSLCAFLGCH